MLKTGEKKIECRFWITVFQVKNKPKANSLDATTNPLKEKRPVYCRHPQTHTGVISYSRCACIFSNFFCVWNVLECQSVARLGVSVWQYISKTYSEFLSFSCRGTYQTNTPRHRAEMFRDAPIDPLTDIRMSTAVQNYDPPTPSFDP